MASVSVWRKSFAIICFVEGCEKILSFFQAPQPQRQGFISDFGHQIIYKITKLWLSLNPENLFGSVKNRGVRGVLDVNVMAIVNEEKAM